MEHVVPEPHKSDGNRVVVHPCGNLLDPIKEAGGPVLYEPGREEEFQALVHDQYAPVRLLWCYVLG